MYPAGRGSDGESAMLDMWETIRTFFLEHYDAFKDFAGPGVAAIIAFFGFMKLTRFRGHPTI